MPNREYEVVDYRGAPIWKTEKKLRNYIEYGVELVTLRRMLERFAKKCPAAVKASGDGKSLMFNLLYLRDFCDFEKLLPVPVPLKTDEWKTADELKAGYIDGASVKSIMAAMEVFQVKETAEEPIDEYIDDLDIDDELFDGAWKPEDYSPLALPKKFDVGLCVVFMNPKTDSLELCLNVKDIDAFIKSFGFKPKKKIDTKILKQGSKAVETLSEADSLKPHYSSVHNM